MSPLILGSTLELAILGLLRQQPRSGYDLLRVFSETAIGNFSNSPGAIYPALKRLCRQKFVSGEIEKKPHPLRPRQVYTLTSAGISALKERLAQPVSRDDVMRRSAVVLLQFVFAGETLGQSAAISVLDQFGREIDHYVRDLRAQLAAMPRGASVYGRSALERGIEGYRADASWARKAIKELKQHGARRPQRRESGRLSSDSQHRKEKS